MMKITIILIMLFQSWVNLIAQDITISFQPKVSGTTIDSIWVTNQRTNEKVKLLGSETLTLRKVTGVYSLPSLPENRHIYPNPCNGSAVLRFSTSLNQEVEVRVYNISGQLLSTESQLLFSGQHRFNVTFPETGIYDISILKNDGSKSFKAVSFGLGVNQCST